MYKKLIKYKVPVNFSVPSGNFGNLCAGLISQKLGLPIKHFLACTNLNNAVPVYLDSGIYNPKPTIQTISNAMDVGDPSNFVRVLEYFSNQGTEMKEFLSAYSIGDRETKLGIKELKERYDYVCDPHGAVGYMGIKKDKELNNNFNYI